MTGAAYLFLTVALVVIKGQHDKTERLRRQRDAARRALARLSDNRPAETPCPDEQALSKVVEALREVAAVFDGSDSLPGLANFPRRAALTGLPWTHPGDE